MDIKSLDYFIKVVDEKSISKVASKYFISQPALSFQIQKLEETFGHKLLIRTNRGVELTEAGQILTDHARNILIIYKQAFEEANNIFGDRNVIRIDSNITLATYSLPCLIYAAQYDKDFKDYYFDLSFSTVNPVEQNIINGMCDVGYVHKKSDYSDIRYVKVGSDPLVLVASADFSAPEKLSMDQLKEYKLVRLNDKFNERKPLEESLPFDIKELGIAMSLDSTESAKTAVHKGFGLSFLPHSSVKKDLREKSLREIRIEGFKEEYPIYLCFLKTRENSSRLLPFLKYLQERKTKDFC